MEILLDWKWEYLLVVAMDKMKVGMLVNMTENLSDEPKETLKACMLEYKKVGKLEH